MREEKQLLLDEIKEKIEESSGFVALSYRNFTAAKARDFRNKMAEVGGEFEVVRKRVFIKAAESVGINMDAKELGGHVGILFAKEDATAIIKKAVGFSEENEQAVTMLGGHVEGAVCSAEDVEAIAKLPALPEMRAQVLGLLEAPMAQTAQILNAILASPLYAMEEQCKKG